MWETQVQSLGGKIRWRKKWQCTPGLLPGESHRQRRLAGYIPWGHKELDTTEWLAHTHTQCIYTRPHGRTHSVCLGQLAHANWAHHPLDCVVCSQLRPRVTHIVYLRDPLLMFQSLYNSSSREVCLSDGKTSPVLDSEVVQASLSAAPGSVRNLAITLHVGRKKDVWMLRERRH